MVAGHNKKIVNLAKTSRSFMLPLLPTPLLPCALFLFFFPVFFFFEEEAGDLVAFVKDLLAQQFERTAIKIEGTIWRIKSQISERMTSGKS